MVYSPTLPMRSSRIGMSTKVCTSIFSLQRPIKRFLTSKMSDEPQANGFIRSFYHFSSFHSFTPHNEFCHFIYIWPKSCPITNCIRVAPIRERLGDLSQLVNTVSYGFNQFSNQYDTNLEMRIRRIKMI